MTKRKDVSAKIRRVLKGGIPEPQAMETLCHLVQMFNGARGLAAVTYEEFHQAKPGSVVRGRLLATIWDLMVKMNDRQSGGSDMGLLSDEDLERKAIELGLKISEDDGPDPPDGAEPQTEAG